MKYRKLPDEFSKTITQMSNKNLMLSKVNIFLSIWVVMLSFTIMVQILGEVNVESSKKMMPFLYIIFIIIGITIIILEWSRQCKRRISVISFISTFTCIILVDMVSRYITYALHLDSNVALDIPIITFFIVSIAIRNIQKSFSRNQVEAIKYDLLSYLVSERAFELRVFDLRNNNKALTPNISFLKLHDDTTVTIRKSFYLSSENKQYYVFEFPCQSFILSSDEIIEEIHMMKRRYEEGELGEMTDLVLEGTLCQSCGSFIGEGDGYPRQCEECELDVEIEE